MLKCKRIRKTGWSVFTGGIGMSEKINQEILDELKKINEKLDKLNQEQEQGLSTPMKFVALLFGVCVVGPVFFVALTALLN